MKFVYALATFALATLLFSSVTAQTYTAVRSGNWSTASGPTTPWDPNGVPPSSCANCTITINSNVTVVLDTHVTLTGTSVLQIGTSSSAPASLLIEASGGTDFASSFNIILSGAGTDNTSLKLEFSNDTVDAISATGMRDGVFTQNGSYSKQVGNRPGTVFNPDGSLSSDFPIQGGNLLLGPITLGSAGPLPIILGGFTAEADKGLVDLKWSTLQESNADHFSVQRLNTSTSAWELLGKIEAQGNSSSQLDYSFVDETPHSGVNEYRIQFVDRDGRYAYSTIAVVHFGTLDVKIFPNPATDYININIGKDAVGTQMVRLITQTGQLLTEIKRDNAAGTVVTLPVSSYPQGNYLIVVTGADGNRQVSKLFISHQ